MAKKEVKISGSLKERILKNSVSKYAAMIKDSEIYDKRWTASTNIPLMDVAVSGKMDGGFQPGFTVIAGPSKHFKTGFCLEFAAAFQRKFPEGLVIFYDSEFGSPPAYFASRGVDMDRVIHIPITNIEDLQFDISAQLDNFERNDPVFIMVDSLGNLPSKKEKEDMLKQDIKADMGVRAKAFKSFFRVITPMLNLKNIPMFGIAHVYDTMEMFSKKVVSGGTGIMLSADNVWIVGREQYKEGTEVKGYNFNINIEKSRFVKEKSKFQIEVRWDGGINKYSGIVDLGIESGHVVRPTLQSYQLFGVDYKKRELLDADTNALEKLLHDPSFIAFVEDKYRIPDGQHFKEVEIPDDDIE